MKKFKSENYKWIIISSVLLFSILCILFLSYAIGVSFDNHNDVKRGTLLWYATMDNTTITEFPVIEPIGDVIYNSIGGDSPSIGTGWGIEYESKAEIQLLTLELINYLKTNGYIIEKVEETQYLWKGKYKKNNSNQLFSGHNKKGESLDLTFLLNKKGTTSITCTIIY